MLLYASYVMFSATAAIILCTAEEDQSTGDRYIELSIAAIEIETTE